MTKLFGSGETPEFTGKAVAHLASDPMIMQKTGRILLTLNLAYEYGFTEDDGTYPVDVLSLKSQLNALKHPWLAAITPGFLRLPSILLHYYAFRF